MTAVRTFCLKAADLFRKSSGPFGQKQRTFSERAADLFGKSSGPFFVSASASLRDDASQANLMLVGEALSPMLTSLTMTFALQVLKSCSGDFVGLGIAKTPAFPKTSPTNSLPEEGGRRL